MKKEMLRCPKEKIQSVRMSKLKMHLLPDRAEILCPRSPWDEATHTQKKAELKK